MWILVPKSSAIELLRSGAARSFLSERLLSDIEPPVLIDTAEEGTIARTVRFDAKTKILAMWNASDIAPIKVADEDILSIWISPDDPGLGSLDAHRTEAITRALHLAQRLWQGNSLPEHWEPKKVEGYSSVFAGDRRLLDVRVAYQLRNDSGRKVLDLGAFYSARLQRVIALPVVDALTLARLPKVILPPDPNSFSFYKSAGQVDDGRQDEDVVMDRPSGTSYNLFALPYDKWVADNGPLTRDQRRVLRHKIERPLRIHGPAGSGKTLTLVLKALGLLREAQEQSRVCHVLLVATTNAVRATVRAAIDAIDDVGFMATNRNDPQFLDVDTLHGWCIRELGLDGGPKYVLEDDPLASRERQREILEKVVDEVLTVTVPVSQTLLSPDFKALIAGNRGHLIRDIGWEISIRIKGRGFRSSDQKLYVQSPMKSFIGRGENEFDRSVIFLIYKKYESYFSDAELLDTDDVVLSMAARLTSSLWDRQRRTMGHDFVLVDETHLFNENERRVLPYLTRMRGEYLPLIMTFDEAQSIGGRRSGDLDSLGIGNSERKTLKAVHRSSPHILALARDLIARSSLVFSEFDGTNERSAMTGAELKRCSVPRIVHAVGSEGVVAATRRERDDLRDRNYQRIGVIVFDQAVWDGLKNSLENVPGGVQIVRERGELRAALPRSGTFLMTPENCGGLEFDAVILVGVDEGIVPPSISNLSPHGYLSLEEEAYKELYTAVTRAKYQLALVTNRRKGMSPLVRASLGSGHLVEA